MSILPISKQLNTLLKRIFSVDPSRRIDIQELRSQFLSCDYYTCHEEKTAKPISPKKLPQICTQSLSFQSAVLEYAYGFDDCESEDDLFPGSCKSVSSSGSSLSWSSLEHDSDHRLTTAFLKQEPCPRRLAPAVTFSLTEDQTVWLWASMKARSWLCCYHRIYPPNSLCVFYISFLCIAEYSHFICVIISFTSFACCSSMF